MAGLVIIDNETNKVRQIGETAASWLLRTGAYAAATALNTATSIRLNTESDTLKKGHPQSTYTDMRFLYGDIPVNNLILKNENKGFIEFVNAKIRVNKQNTIVETPLVNRVGTIKEYIAAKDYTIDVSGDIIVNTNSYPIIEIHKVNEFLSAPETFEVVNVYLGAFHIDKMVFKNGNFNQQGQKFFNALPFDFTFTSDNDSENSYGLIMKN
jgi:hypothetical protein